MTDHSARAEAIQQVAARFIAGEPLTESDRAWIIFTLGMAYRSELDSRKRAGLPPPKPGTTG
jgi:hypothetical protein